MLEDNNSDMENNSGDEITTMENRMQELSENSRNINAEIEQVEKQLKDMNEKLAKNDSDNELDKELDGLMEKLFELKKKFESSTNEIEKLNSEIATKQADKEKDENSDDSDKKNDDEKTDIEVKDEKPDSTQDEEKSDGSADEEEEKSDSAKCEEETDEAADEETEKKVTENEQDADDTETNEQEIKEEVITDETTDDKKDAECGSDEEAETKELKAEDAKEKTKDEKPEDSLEEKKEEEVEKTEEKEEIPEEKDSDKEAEKVNEVVEEAKEVKEKIETTEEDILEVEAIDDIESKEAETVKDSEKTTTYEKKDKEISGRIPALMYNDEALLDKILEEEKEADKYNKKPSRTLSETFSPLKISEEEIEVTKQESIEAAKFESFDAETAEEQVITIDIIMKLFKRFSDQSVALSKASVEKTMKLTTTRLNEFSKNITMIERYIKEIASKMNLFQQHMNQLTGAFNKRFLEDKTKDKAFNKLYDSLKDYKDNFLLKAQKPLFTDMIRMYDDINKMMKKGGRNSEELGFVCEMIIEILYRNDITIIKDAPAKFDSTIQKAVKRIDTENQVEDRKVSEVVRDGFMWSDIVLRPQEVVVFRFKGDKSKKN